MAQNALIQVRVDEDLKESADALFADLGMDTPTAIRIFLRQAIMNEGLPFEVRLVPNAETIVAMEDVRLGRNLKGPFNNVKDLMTSLMGEDDV